MWLFALFLAYPLIEISLFVVIGGWIGLWPTLAVVLGTGVLGVSVLRGLGLKAGRDLRMRVRDPGVLLAQGAMSMVAAVLLILPGFLTDGLGLVLLVPWVQRLVLALVLARMSARGFGQGPRSAPMGPGGGPVIDGEFIEITRPGDRPSGASKWSRH